MRYHAYYVFFFFFSSRRRHTRFDCDWSSDVCSSDLVWRDHAGGSTNEDGEFRIAELQPGTYYLSAGPSSNPVSAASGSSNPGALGFPVVYYPAGSDLSSASPISITPGKRLEIHLTISAQSCFSVTG